MRFPITFLLPALLLPLPAAADDPASFAFPGTLLEARELAPPAAAATTRRALQDLASSWVVVPAAVNAPGAQGAYFRTKVTILSLGPSATDVKAWFYPSAGSPRSTTFRISSAETRTFPNVVQDLFGVTGAGALLLDTPIDYDLVVTSEVYNDGPAGRFSTATIAWGILDFLGSTYFDWTPGVTVDGRTRANLACWNSSSSSAIVRVGLYDAPAPGPKIKEFEFELPGYGWKQIAVDVPVSGGTLLWKPFGGLNYCYAVNVDNASNDGTFLDRVTWVP